MRRGHWLIVVGLLLAGCEDFYVHAVTIVAGDGTFTRRVAMRREGGTGVVLKGHGTDNEDSAQSPLWNKFDKPAAPYELSGPTDGGWIAEAKFESGEHGSGIRRKLSEQLDEIAEGKVRVEVSDLLMGKLFRFRENVALGADSVRFRKELRRWLELGLDVFMDALRYRMPQADLDGVERNARERLVPRVAASLLLVRQNIESVTFDYRNRGATGEVEDWEDLFRHPEIGSILDEIARYGLVRAKGREEPTSNEDLFDEGAWEFEPRFLREFFAPMRGVTEKEREELIASFVDQSIELDMQGALKNIYPEEEKRKALDIEAARFGVAALGSYLTYGMLDDHHFEFELTLPGTLLFTNGELGAAPAIRWTVDDASLFLRDPEMHAVSFVPDKGAPANGWRLAPLVELKAALEGISAEDRALLRGFYAGAAESGWRKALKNMPEDSEHLADAIDALRAALDSAAR